MSQVAIYDPLEYIRELRSCGFSQEQAETQAKGRSKVLESCLQTNEETVAQLSAKIEKVDDTVKRIDARLTEHEKRSSEQFEKINARMDAMDARLGTMEACQQEMKADQKEMRADLNAMNLRMVEISATMDKIEMRLLSKIGGIVATTIVAMTALSKYLLP